MKINLDKKYIYPAVISHDIPDEYGIVFPDISGCTGQCSRDIDVMKYAEETLAAHIELMLENNEEIPEPSILHSNSIILVELHLPLLKAFFQFK